MTARKYKKASRAEVAGRETIESRTKRVRRLIRRLRKTYGDADCALTHGSAFELLIATILSAQSTDETVNKVTPVLFEAFPDAGSLAVADTAGVEKIVHATGFFRQKAKNIIATAQRIVEHFDGEVPATIDDLITLPGVARKTANVVLGTWFGKNVGIAVDTHVGRLCDRLRLTWNHKDNKDAVQIEEDLMRIVNQKDWTYISHAMIWHGRRVCSARKPSCKECVLAADCPSEWQAI